MKKREDKNIELPSDMLEIIYKKLDFDELFQFGGVCEDWRKVHKYQREKVMKSRAPLVIQTSSYAKKIYFFFSISQQKIYSTKLANFWRLSYLGFSSGSVIMENYHSDKILIMNPFIRRKIEISTRSLICYPIPSSCSVTLAFVKGTLDFIIAFLCKRNFSLDIYDSRKSSWFTYARYGRPFMIADLVVLDHTMFFITNTAKIGALKFNRNHGKEQFLELKNAPNITSSALRLLTYEGNLLVVNFRPRIFLQVYKIDMIRMEWVKLEDLGDAALFLTAQRKCYTLSNSEMWGYERNHVYYINGECAKCFVYSMENELVKTFMPHSAVPVNSNSKSKLYWLDWCFPNVSDEIDYSIMQ
ncbi:hypothetical protein Lal_00038349 [Lupinus albus]|uniref:Putative F-box domain-containing protein n=1 Tax=Lupinus albus TaxID=3870 RepID=A0A6A4NE58_LUPAL|nr:putative F-box domain-containing protein [Lupinus albus]KAF1883857.1 hypothetical protein Lal_00038349 [Lupinus albus]